MNKTFENKAISVVDEAANIYYEKIRTVPNAMKRLSVHDIREIFNKCVIPTINEVRRLDREQTHSTK